MAMDKHVQYLVDKKVQEHEELIKHRLRTYFHEAKNLVSVLMSFTKMLDEDSDAERMRTLSG